MSKKAICLWSLWIGAMVAGFVFVYLVSPLGEYGLLWMSFVSMPLFFAGGAKRSEFLSYSACNCVGVVWGICYLYLIGIFAGLGFSGSLATMFTVCIVTPACCMAHMLTPDRFLLNKLAATFGAIACVFSQNGTLLIPTAATLVAGVFAGLLCMEGRQFFVRDDIPKTVPAEE